MGVYGITVSGGKNIAWSEMLNCMMKCHIAWCCMETGINLRDLHAPYLLTLDSADKSWMDDQLPDLVMVFTIAAGFVLFAQ